jgi:protein arginine kinase activator
MKLSEGNKPRVPQTLTCPKCRLTLDEFRKTSKFGCDACYGTFEPYIKQILKSVQGTFHHTGKEPKRLSRVDAMKHQQEELESKLRIALMQEDYLEAAKLRDALNTFKEGLE